MVAGVFGAGCLNVLQSAIPRSLVDGARARSGRRAGSSERMAAGAIILAEKPDRRQLIRGNLLPRLHLLQVLRRRTSLLGGVVATARAVSPPQPMTRQSDQRDGAGALPDRDHFAAIDERHQEQRQDRQRRQITRLPTISSGPSNSFSIWNRNRKYHSGRGMKLVSVGSATCPSGTRAKIAMPISTANHRNVATVSLNTCSG